MYYSDEPFVAAVAATEPGEDLVAVIANTDGGPEVARIALPRSDAPWRAIASCPPLAPGVYRVVVAGSKQVEPLSDVFLVA